MNRQIRITPAQLIYIVIGIILTTGVIITVIILSRDSGDVASDGAVIVTGTETPAATSTATIAEATPELVTNDTPEPVVTSTIQPYEHLVEEGETLYYIIQLYGYQTLDIVPEILALNGMANENDLVAGTAILIPKQTPTPRAPEPAGPAESEPAESVEDSTVESPTDVPAGSGDEPDYSACNMDNQCVSEDGNYWIHIVQDGETIAGLAFGYGTRVDDIQQANNLPNDIIYPSQQLQIPILVTLTPTLTPTGGPDSTATPVPGFPAPTLLAPVNGTEFDRAQGVFLQWLSDRPLGEGENYLIIVRNRDTGDEFKAVTTATVFRLPAELQPDLNQTLNYEWTVLVVDGASVNSQVISSLGSANTFSWG